MRAGLVVVFTFFTMVAFYAQTTINPNTGDAYLLFGPNTNWSQYFQVGGNGRVTSHASIFATNGNLHLDSKNGSFSTYINHYSQGNTILNSQGGKVGIRTTNPKAVLDVGKTLSSGEIGSVLARLPEGNGNGDGTYLGVKGYATQGSDINNIKSFALEHSFYGITNSSINFYRGGGTTGGFLTFNTNTNLERVRVSSNGYMGIGTTTPDRILDVTGGNTWQAKFSNSSETKRFYLGWYDSRGAMELATWGDGVWESVPLHILPNTTFFAGNVGIGSKNPDAKLTVKGNIHAEEVKVDLSVPGPDYVFKEDYDLKSLEEVQNHIEEHGHLPNIPSAQEMERDGIQLGEMNMKLLEKIEELTLYILKQERRIRALEQNAKE